MNYITVNKNLLLIPQSKSANMEALLLYYIRTKCNKDNASAIGEKEYKMNWNYQKAQLKAILKAERIYRYTIHKDFNP